MARMMNQNHRATKIFSLMMFSARTHIASWVSIVPEAPYLWNVHFVILRIYGDKVSLLAKK